MLDHPFVKWALPVLSLSSMVLLSGCAPVSPTVASAKPAKGATLSSCASLQQFRFDATVLSSVHEATATERNINGVSVGEHCVVTGTLQERVSAVDGQTYAIGFEMRLPVNWNGRFLFQANGGLAGVVSPAVGEFGGGAVSNALQQGFAIISADMGHSSKQNPLFGLDPQARVDYGYAAVERITPMAKALIKSAYGKAPDYSYFAGCSNGGRLTMVAASRYATLYDGFLAGNPGMQLPKSAVAQLYGAQQYARITGGKELSGALTSSERQLIASKILEKCDALDGAVDGMVLTPHQCQQRFDLQRDVPTCSGSRDGSCLSSLQKEVLSNVHAGARTPSGSMIYAPFLYDRGLVGSDWANWEFSASLSLDPAAVAFVFNTPPNAAGVLKDLASFTLSYDLTRDLNATVAPYNESALSFMTMPDPTLRTLRQQHGKLLVYHGTADAVFSAADTASWYEALQRTHGSDTGSVARYFEVPGMNHCRGGPATDQFDLLTALVAWVELQQAPERVVATARGAGNAGGINNDVPAEWGTARSRPLCAYPKTAHYNGSGDLNSADNFSCR